MSRRRTSPASAKARSRARSRARRRSRCGSSAASSAPSPAGSAAAAGSTSSRSASPSASTGSPRSRSRSSTSSRRSRRSRSAFATGCPTGARRRTSPRTSRTSTIARPVFETLPGWSEELVGSTLPARQRPTWHSSRSALAVPVGLVGTGAARDAVLTLLALVDSPPCASSSSARAGGSTRSPGSSRSSPSLTELHAAPGNPGIAGARDMSSRGGGRREGLLASRAVARNRARRRRARGAARRGCGGRAPARWHPRSTARPLPPRGSRARSASPRR